MKAIQVYLPDSMQALDAIISKVNFIKITLIEFLETSSLNSRHES
ncbi:MAG: hypothetical protein ACP5T2_05305 [Thermoprotei archaeon]